MACCAELAIWLVTHLTSRKGAMQRVQEIENGIFRSRRMAVRQRGLSSDRVRRVAG